MLVNTQRSNFTKHKRNAFGNSELVRQLDTIFESPSFQVTPSTSSFFKTPEKKSFFSPWRRPYVSPDFSKAFESPEKSMDKSTSSSRQRSVKAVTIYSSSREKLQSKDYRSPDTTAVSVDIGSSGSLNPGSASSFTSSPRCSTPVKKRMTRKLLKDDLNLSCISVCQQNTTHESSKLFTNSNSKISKNVKVRTHQDLNFSEKKFGTFIVPNGKSKKISFQEKVNLHFPRDDLCNYSFNESQSSGPSFVTRAFRNTSDQTSDINLPLSEKDNAVSSATRTKNEEENEEKLPRTPKFPKFAPFCNKTFYQYLRKMMEPKYELRTNREAVRVAKYISGCVTEVISTKEDCQNITDVLKKSLFRKQIIKTHLDYFYFCIKFLPSSFVRKAVPMIHPVGMTSIEFDWNLMGTSVE